MELNWSHHSEFSGVKVGVGLTEQWCISLTFSERAPCSLPSKSSLVFNHVVTLGWSFFFFESSFWSVILYYIKTLHSPSLSHIEVPNRALQICKALADLLRFPPLQHFQSNPQILL